MTSTVETTSVDPVETLKRLFAALDAANVRYCHWKSNSHLAEAVRGETDLDLLIERRQAGVFRQTLVDLDFKPLVAAPGKHYASVENHLGYDPASGRLLHLHVHFHLVLGQQFVKDYRLPIEDWVLDSVRRVNGVAIPSAEVELIILTVRAALKYRIRDAIKDTFKFGQPGIPRRISNEIRWLLDQTNLQTAMEVLEEQSDCLPTALIRQILAELGRSERHGLGLLKLRQQLRTALHPYQRISRARATAQYFLAVGRKKFRWARRGPKQKMTPQNGGISIGFVGADGAGKSTVIAEISDWLGWRLDVTTVYMGISTKGIRARPLKAASKVARSSHRRVTGRSNDAGLLGSITGHANHDLIGRRRLGEARTRLRAYLAARSAAARGAVVLFDRYPLASVQVMGRSMDGPRLGQELAHDESRKAKRMIAREQMIFDKILSPDRLIALEVNPETSLQRKPDHDPKSVRAKAAAIASVGTGSDDLAVVDADQPLALVIEQVKTIVWNWL